MEWNRKTHSEQSEYPIVFDSPFAKWFYPGNPTVFFIPVLGLVYAVL
jgi:hypothetical protein